MPRRAVHADELREDLDRPTGADAAGHVNRQAFTGPLVDDRQAFERLPIRTGVEHEVVRPHVVPGGRRQRPGPSRGHPAPRAPPRDLQPRLAPEPMRAIGAYHVPLSSQEDPNPTIPVARVLGRQTTHRGQRRGIPHRQPRLVAQGRPRHREHGARAAV